MKPASSRARLSFRVSGKSSIWPLAHEIKPAELPAFLVKNMSMRWWVIADIPPELKTTAPKPTQRGVSPPSIVPSPAYNSITFDTKERSREREIWIRPSGPFDQITGLGIGD